MNQPQSDEQIRPVVEALRRRDPLLDVIWDPKARMLKPGNYDAAGGIRTDPVYDGRWRVIRRDTNGLQNRDYVIICTVTKPTRIGRRQILFMEENGEYAHVEEWLTEFIDTWDRAARHAMDVEKERDRIDAEIDAEEDTRAAHQQALEKVFHESGGTHAIGGAQGKAHPETIKTLFGKGRKTAAPEPSTAGAPS